MYTYETLPTAPASTYTVTATVNYQATWSATDGTAGAAGAPTVSASEPVTVVEIQALNTYP